MNWLRWYHGCVTDPKFPLIARRSGQNVAPVLAVWAALLERASQAHDRGSIEGFDCDSFDALFGLEDGACQSILSAFESKGMIADGRVAKWDERQNKDETAAERKRLQREREKLSQEKVELEALRASCHAMSHDATDGQPGAVPSGTPGHDAGMGGVSGQITGRSADAYIAGSLWLPLFWRKKSAGEFSERRVRLWRSSL